MPDRAGKDPSPATAEIAALGLEGCRALLEAGSVTSVELTETLLARIAALDSAGPCLRAVISVAGDALDTARQLDLERRSGSVRGPLHGVPVLVKDNIDTAGSLATTAGSFALSEPASQPAADATVVTRLRGAGAIVIGKANLSEWANFRSRHSSSGWSAVGGQCRNPHALDRSPGGSSSGSGAGVAARLAPAAVGTETDGSILCPAALCGVVGIKPTVGLVSRTGVVPISASQDTVGPIARSVADAAVLLGVLAGPDPRDPACARRPQDLPADYAGLLDPAALRGARIGVARLRYFGHNRWADSAAERAIEAMAELGAEIVDPADIETAEELARVDDEMTVLLHEFKVGLDAYLLGRPGGPAACPRTLEQLIEFDESAASREMSVFGHDILVAAAETGGLEEPAYVAALARNLERARAKGIDATLSRHRLDAIVAPTIGPAWHIDHLNGDAHLASSYEAAAVAGYPAISLPVGAVRGLPLGLCLMGTAWSEPTLIPLAYALEQALSLDLEPTWRDTVPF